MQKKQYTLGIDIGSISIGLALLGPDNEITQTSYCFHKGNIEQELIRLLQQYDISGINGIAVTTSTPGMIKRDAGYDTQVAYITAARYFNPELCSLLIIGGEKFGLISFDEDGEYQNYRSNTSCAAGTGSFLDQQAKRLNLETIEEFSRIAFENKGDVPKIASRCAVFAKTDLIHAQQEGYTLQEICDGLTMGLAKNICDTLFSKTKPGETFVMAGGVSLNRAVQNHIEHILGLEIVTNEYTHLYGAIGAALCLAEENQDLAGQYETSKDLLEQQEITKDYYYKPLTLRLSKYPDFSSNKTYLYASKLYPLATDVEVDLYIDFTGMKKTDVYCGIDIGSTSTKSVLMDRNLNVLAAFYTRTSGRPLEAVQVIFESMNDIRQTYRTEFHFLGMGTTGSGRKFIGEIIGSDLVLDEITAHARAAYQLDNEVDTIIEIGGQDAKFTTMSNGMVTFSVMNNVCAAGTGSFIEEQAKKLGCPLAEYSIRAEQVTAPLSSDRCTVFMERDINFYLNNGYSVDEVLASVLHSVRENYLVKVAVEKNIGQKIFFQGATAKNKALVAAFEQKLKKPIMVSKFCHVTGAMGVALQLADEQNAQTRFKGVSLYKNPIPLNSEICDLCMNHCKIKKAEVDGQVVAYGFLCGRDYDTKQFVKNNTSGFDLLKERDKIIAFKKKPVKSAIKIGIPATLHLADDYMMWEKFFNLLNIQTINSINYKSGLKDGKQLTSAEFCAPITNLHGHVNYLKDKADYIFLPNYLELRTKSKNKRRHYCYYTQYSPSVIASTNKLGVKEKLISPLLKSKQGAFYRKVQLFMRLKKITDIKFFQVSTAYDKACAYYNESQDKLKELYIQETKDQQDIHVVLLGRPYTILSQSLNNGIPGIFGKLGIKTFFQDMLTYTSEDIMSLEKLLTAFHWNYASKILESAEVISRAKGIYPVLVTSFKCSPDSFAVEYFKKIMDARKKPYLVLQLDEHDSSVGYETRIEAAIRSFRNHYRLQDISGSKSYEFNLKTVYNKNELGTKKLLIPSWDPVTSRLLQAAVISEGVDARIVQDTPQSIQKSLSSNTGQCIPLNIITQNFIDYIEENQLDTKETAIWMFNSFISCNIRLYPYYIKKLLEDYGKGMEHLALYFGDITFKEMSFAAIINSYFAYMFGGLLRKTACKIRPYEVNKGETDRVLEKSIEILYGCFINNGSKEVALKEVINLFDDIEYEKKDRPKVAIFGDLYARDNDVFNQNLVKTIEDNGGEVITTPYSEYMKIIADAYIKKWMQEGYFSDVALAKVLKATIPLLERKYYKLFNRVLDEPKHTLSIPVEKMLTKFGLRIQHTGESLDNILKIFSLVETYPDLTMFIQTNPSYCCPSLVTEAMANEIEEMTGVPIVSIEYDGTNSNKNSIVIPYLKYPRRQKNFVRDEIVKV